MDHLPAIPLELVVEEPVSQRELDSEQEEVQELTCYEVAKIPGVVMENRLEIFDKFLDHRLLDNSIVIFGVLTDHHLSSSLLRRTSFRNWLSHTGVFPSVPKLDRTPPSRAHHTRYGK